MRRELHKFQGETARKQKSVNINKLKLKKKKREKNWLKDIETDREKTRSIM